MRRMLLAALLAAMPAAAAIADADYYNFEDDRIVPLGSRAAGTNTVSLVGRLSSTTSSAGTATSATGCCG